MTRSRISLLLLLLALLALAVCAPLTKAVTWNYDTTPVTQQVVSSTGAASTLTATLTGSAQRMTYIEGFDLSGGGGTAASVINVTITGTTNTLNFSTNILAGATGPAFGNSSTTGQGIYSVRFPTPIPASATNTNIVVSVPSFGTGNTLQSVTVYGFTQ